MHALRQINPKKHKILVCVLLLRPAVKNSTFILVGTATNLNFKNMQRSFTNLWDKALFYSSPNFIGTDITILRLSIDNKIFLSISFARNLVSIKRVKNKYKAL